MRKLRTGVAIAALMIAAPAMACTDWKAVAALDAIIAAHASETGHTVEWKENATGAMLNEVRDDKALALADKCGGQQG